MFATLKIKNNSKNNLYKFNLYEQQQFAATQMTIQLT